MNDNPYVGPRSIGGVDHQGEQIYGRSREISQLVDLLIADRGMLVYSPSGAGKSSLLQAGLAPAMTKQRFQVRPIMRVNLEPPPRQFRSGTWQPVYAQRAALAGGRAAEGQEEDAGHRTGADDAARVSGRRGEWRTADLRPVRRGVDGRSAGCGGEDRIFTQVGAALRDRGRWAVFAMREITWRGWICI